MTLCFIKQIRFMCFIKQVHLACSSLLGRSRILWVDKHLTLCIYVFRKSFRKSFDEVHSLGHGVGKLPGRPLKAFLWCRTSCGNVDECELHSDLINIPEPSQSFESHNTTIFAFSPR